MAKIYAVCSGCGGVGKTMIALSLAVSAAKRGKRTILLDASGVSRACDLALGLENVVVLDMADVAESAGWSWKPRCTKRRNTKTCALPARRSMTMCRSQN